MPVKLNGVQVGSIVKFKAKPDRTAKAALISYDNPATKDCFELVNDNGTMVPFPKINKINEYIAKL